MKILLVDDSKSARYALRLQLQRHGVEVETADCAESALDQLKDGHPDAIFMDHMMPGMNGFEALDALRADPKTAGIPVVMCSSHEESDFIATAEKKGVLGILPKSEAQDRLPDILARIEQAIAPADTPNEAPAPAESAAPAEAPAPAAPALSEETLNTLIDTQLRAQLGDALNPFIEDLRRDLTEQLLAESRQLVETRLSDWQAAQPPAAPVAASAPSETLRAELESQLESTLFERLRLEIESERGRLLELLDTRQQATPPNLAPMVEQAMQSQLANLGEQISQKVLTAARREMEVHAERSTERQNEEHGKLAEEINGLKKLAITLSVLAMVLGLGAAATVYLLLQPI